MRHLIFLVATLYASLSLADIPAPPPNLKPVSKATATQPSDQKQADQKQVADPDPRMEKIIGRWETNLNGMVVFFEFKADQKCEAGEGGDSRSGTYAMDFSTTPYHLDFLIDGHRGYSIFEITPEGLRIARPDEENRPTEFGDISLIFKRSVAQKLDPKVKEIMGKWVAHDGKSTVSLEIKPNQKCTTGESNKTQEVTCTFDFSVTPHHLQFVINGQSVYSIIEVTSDSLRIAEPKGDAESRPAQFGEKSLTFKRVTTKPKTTQNPAPVK
jgi:hypothetical protein